MVSLLRKPPAPNLSAGMFRQRVLVNLRGSRSAFRGVFLEADDSWVVLVGGVDWSLALLEEFDEGVKETPMDNKAYIPAGQVEFINVVNPGDG